jgi:post-segregation antitoxin (ccd killing protein)
VGEASGSGHLSGAVLLWYACGMTTTKRKVSVSLDEDLVAELEAGGEALSSQVNEAVRLELERRRRHRLLSEMLEDLEASHGPVDEKLVRKYLELLG